MYGTRLAPKELKFHVVIVKSDRVKTTLVPFIDRNSKYLNA